MPELLDLLPTRDAREIEQVIIDWQHDIDAQRLYMEIRQQSVTALKDIERMKQQIGEGDKC